MNSGRLVGGDQELRRDRPFPTSSSMFRIYKKVVDLQPQAEVDKTLKYVVLGLKQGVSCI